MKTTFKKETNAWMNVKSNTMHLENRQDEFSFHANFNSYPEDY